MLEGIGVMNRGQELQFDLFIMSWTANSAVLGTFRGTTPDRQGAPLAKPESYRSTAPSGERLHNDALYSIPR